MHGNGDAGLTCPFLPLPTVLVDERFRVVRSEPRNRFGGFVALIADLGDRAQARSLWTSKQAIHDFTLDQITEERNVFGSIKQIQKTATRLQQINCSLPDGDAPSVG